MTPQKKKIKLTKRKGTTTDAIADTSIQHIDNYRDWNGPFGDFRGSQGVAMVIVYVLILEIN